MDFRSSRRYSAIITGFITLVLLSVSISGVFGQGRPNVNPAAAAQEIPTNQWAVKIMQGSDPNAVAQMAGMVNLGPVANLPDYYLFEAPALNTFDGVATRNISRALRSAPGVTFAEQQIIYPRASRVITDPLYGNQWHLNNTGQGGGTAGEDANVIAAWNAGYDGTGVVVAINDDGVDYNHPDIADHWRAADSYDYLNGDADVLGGAHGTSVAGVTAASDNADCGVGVAYNADIAGIVTGDQLDGSEASSLAHKIDVIDLMNNSWGPFDDGQTWGGVNQTSLDALELGATTGRGGLGVIYVWAGGNGGDVDNTGADSFVNSRYTIGVGASTNAGTRSWYSERGSALLVNAPSNGGTAGITTTDRVGGAGYSGGDCTNSFGGTSSASPLVAGVVALMLDANPNLTWRDVQAILLQTAEKNHPADGGWMTNEAGYHVHPAYGFGRVDAGAAVAAAATWTNLAPEVNFSSGTLVTNAPIPDADYAEFTFNVTQPITVESVEVVLNATHPYRGDIQVELLSPGGTRSVMLYRRENDSGDNISDYTLLSTHQWGESAVGTWKLLVKDMFAEEDNGTLNNWELKINGTLESGSELLQNGSFEVYTGRQPEHWIPSVNTRGRVRCNTDVKTFAFDADCAYMIRTQTYPQRLKQNIGGEIAASVAVGDTLAFNLHLKTRNVIARTVALMRVIYDETHPDTGARYREKVLVKTTAGSSGGYYAVNSTPITTTYSVAKIRVFLKYGGAGNTGKVFYDAVSVLHTAQGAALKSAAPDAGIVPLPEAPEGFRR